VNSIYRDEYLRREAQPQRISLLLVRFANYFSARPAPVCQQLRTCINGPWRISVRSMASVVSKEVYFETGLEILADKGYGGLKLAEVCSRLGVTTGSFYHYFANWSAYTTELVSHWLRGLTLRRVARLRSQPDPRKRIDEVIAVGMSLPHGAEAAIRSWSSVDPMVRVAQEDVDRQRFQVLRDAALEILGSARQAELFANWALYLLVGYEQSTLPPDTAGLAWITNQLLDTLDSGRFATVPE